MLFHKKSKQSGFSLIYSLVISLICILIVISLLSIEIERKKYLKETQRSFNINQEIEPNDYNNLSKEEYKNCYE